MDCLEKAIHLPKPSLPIAGELGTEFFALAAGSVTILKDGKRIGGMSAPDYFGELALHTQAPRAVTIEVTLQSPMSHRVSPLPGRSCTSCSFYRW